MSEGRFAGAVVVVTGGGRGLGKAIALSFAREGGTVVVCDLDQSAIEEVARQMDDVGGAGHAVVADVRVGKDTQRLIEATVEQCGRVDVLVNCAAVALRRLMFDVEESFWDQHLDTNLKGAFFCAQAAAREMVARGVAGRIINIGCVGGWAAQRHLSAYNASKGGLNLLTKSLALELAPHGITVNEVCPGAILGTKNRELFEQPSYLREWRKSVPMNRPAANDDITPLVLFLASGDAAYITGQIIYVEGGKLCYVPSVNPPASALH